MEEEAPIHKECTEMPIEDVLNVATFEKRFQQILHVQSSVFSQAAQNILKGQEKQRKSF